jgi:hypothetical protein
MKFVFFFFFNPYLSGSLLTPFFHVSSFVDFYTLFHALDLLGVFFSYVLGLYPLHF